MHMIPTNEIAFLNFKQLLSHVTFALKFVEAQELLQAVY